MPRIQGVDIPNDKPTYISLQYLHGVGQATAISACHRLKINPQAKARELTDDDIQRINHLLDNEYVVEGKLRRSDADQHSAFARHSVLSRNSASSRVAGSRPADPHQRADTQGRQEDRGGQEGREGHAALEHVERCRVMARVGLWRVLAAMIW